MKFFNLLIGNYTAAYGTVWKDSFDIKCQLVENEQFEIADNMPEMLQPEGEGTAKFTNPSHSCYEVIDFEAFVNQFSQSVKAGQGKKCDFIVAATSGNGTFVLNELSHLWSKSLKTFPQKEQEYSGKQDKAIGQLMASIERLFKSPELKAFIESYQSQIALFSIRLKDTTQAENVAMQSMSTFLQPLASQREVTFPHLLSNGFTFKRVIYPNSFVLK